MAGPIAAVSAGGALGRARTLGHPLHFDGFAGWPRLRSETAVYLPVYQPLPTSTNLYQPPLAK